VVNGQTTYPSENLDENQRELTHFGAVSWQHSAGALNWQTAFVTTMVRFPSCVRL